MSFRSGLPQHKLRHMERSEQAGVGGPLASSGMTLKAAGPPPGAIDLCRSFIQAMRSFPVGGRPADVQRLSRKKDYQGREHT